MNKTRTLTLAMVIFLPGVTEAQDWKMQPLQIQTRWAALVSPTNALPEYPRPQLVRRDWQNLNGLWHYAITARDAEMPARYEGSILVPYPLESTLSGVQKPLQPDQLLWYGRTFALEPGKEGNRTLLHFGAVDYQATVYLNGREVGAHTGGYQSFTFDITDALKPGDNELVVKVYDPTDAGPNPHGKQTLHPQGIFYTSSSGIWQTVWLETVSQTYIESLIMTPDVDGSQLHVQVNLKGKEEGYTVQAIVKSGSAIVATQSVNGPTSLPISHPRLWSPNDPFLYDLQVRVLKDGKIVDEVKSYFGLRKIEVRKDAAGVERIFLNARYTYNLGVLDQGFWPDGLYTAPTDAALKFDIEAIKAMGFNTIRKHVKVEPDRWYYHCDKLGMLVWQDMVPPANGTSEARAEFEKEIQANLAQLHNHPSIITWVLFNEGWGAYDQERLAERMKRLDPSRLLNGHSGPYDPVRLAQWLRHLDPMILSRIMKGEMVSGLEPPREEGSANWVSADMVDIHSYPDPKLPPAEIGKARVVGEYGGLGSFIDGHTWNDLAPGFSYAQMTPDQLTKAYAEKADKLKALEAQGLSGSIYTQLVDVEGEQNGLMTYDRAVIKRPVVEIAKINGQLVQKAENYAATTQGFSAMDADLTPEAQRYAALLEQYQKGERDFPFLRNLTLVALRQKDQARATEAGNEFIKRSSVPYSKELWAFIYAVTRTTKDKGFEVLRMQLELANAMPARNAAETKIREVIGREEIEPNISDESRTPDWAAIEKNVFAKFGALGAEKVYGAEMMYYLQKQDWTNFGKYFVLYFDTATARSEYPINNISYVVFEHVTNSNVLEAASKAQKYSVDSGTTLMGTFAKDDPTEIDTYANLLYKVHRTQEAIEWEEKAVQLSEGRDREIVDHFEKMKAGQPTWPAR
jgi:hypothetical protein